MSERWAIAIALAIQAICAGFFLSDILSSYVGFRSTPISWKLREIIELGAAFGLVLGFVLGAVALRRSVRRRNHAEAALRTASREFMELLHERFDEWGLTPAERDVALFAVKGLSLKEIAELRETSEGTVKAQTNAIYRKAGVSGRAQLISSFVEDLMSDGLPGVVPGGSQTR